jgi:hypothetical protein
MRILHRMRHGFLFWDPAAFDIFTSPLHRSWMLWSLSSLDHSLRGPTVMGNDGRGKKVPRSNRKAEPNASTAKDSAEANSDDSSLQCQPQQIASISRR